MCPPGQTCFHWDWEEIPHFVLSLQNRIRRSRALKCPQRLRVTRVTLTGTRVVELSPARVSVVLQTCDPSPGLVTPPSPQTAPQDWSPHGCVGTATLSAVCTGFLPQSPHCAQERACTLALTGSCVPGHSSNPQSPPSALASTGWYLLTPRGHYGELHLPEETGWWGQKFVLFGLF